MMSFLELLCLCWMDEPVSVFETKCEARNMKANKACGTDGLTPGVFKMLPMPWLLLLITIFNSIFSSGNYPVAWTRAKIFTIYKKGDRRSPKNYRGISVINSCAKLYDMILCCSRLIKALVQTIQRASRCSREARLHGAHCNSSYLV